MFIGVNVRFKSIAAVSPWTTISDGCIMYRRGLRDGFYIIDFSSDCGINWEEIVSYEPTEEIAVILANPGTDYRVVIRDYAMCVDHVLGGSGFDGTEGVDWEEIESYTTPYAYFITRTPSDLTVSRADGGAKLDWTDNSDNEVKFQVWLSLNGGVTYSQVGSDISEGTETYTHSNTYGIELFYKIRAAKEDNYSAFTDAVSIKMALGYYPLNTCIGNDYSGNGYNCTQYQKTIAGLAVSQNNVLSAIYMDGAGFNLLQVPAAIPALCLSGEMTVCAWIKPNDVAAGLRLIVSSLADSGAGNTQNFLCEINRTAKRLTFTWGGPAIVTSGTDLAVENWYHVAFRRSGSTGAWTGTIFLNGNDDGHANTVTNPATTTTNKFSIGTNNPRDNYRFKGTIDDVRVYDRALSDTEIAAIAANIDENPYHVFASGPIYTDTVLDTLRTTLRGLIFTSGYPSGGVTSITEDVADPLDTSPTNLDTVDKLIVEVTGIADRECYMWNPITPNGKLAIFHGAHWKSVGEEFEPAGMADTVRALVEADYTVIWVPMPPGTTGEGDTHDGMGYDGVEDLELFLTAGVKILNEYATQFTSVYIAGLSGGGWSSVFLGALDERITKVAEVGGSLPYYLTQKDIYHRDFEQQLIGLYDKVEYTDLYLMCCTSNREFKKYLITLETAFNLARYNYDPFAESINSITDNFELVWDVGSDHEISEDVKNQIIAFFNN